MPTIRENLVLARDILATIPQENLDLESWYERYSGSTPACGTIACAAGWLALRPEFNAQGLLHDSDRETITSSGGAWGTHALLNDMFGFREFNDTDGAFQHLFAQRGCGEWDKEILKCLPGASDRDLAVARFNRAIFEWDKEHANNS